MKKITRLDIPLKDLNKAERIAMSATSIDMACPLDCKNCDMTGLCSFLADFREIIFQHSVNNKPIHAQFIITDELCTISSTDLKTLTINFQ